MNESQQGQVNWGKVLLGGTAAATLVLGALFALALHTGQARTVAPPPVTAPPTEPTPIAEPVPPPTPAAPDDSETARHIAEASRENRDSLLCTIEGESDRTTTFALLDRSPQRFEGHWWVFNGRAIQVQDIPDSQGSFALVSLDSYAENIVAVFTHLRPSDSVVADRRVRVYGRVAGTFSYDTRAGGARTVPRVDAVAVVRDGEAPRCRRMR